MSVGARVTTTMRDLNHIKDWHDVTKVTLSCIESSTTAFEFLKVLLFIHCRSFKTTSRWYHLCMFVVVYRGCDSRKSLMNNVPPTYKFLLLSSALPAHCLTWRRVGSVSKKLTQLFFHSEAETLAAVAAASRSSKLCNLIWERDEISSRCSM